MMLRHTKPMPSHHASDDSWLDNQSMLDGDIKSADEGDVINFDYNE